MRNNRSFCRLFIPLLYEKKLCKVNPWSNVEFFNINFWQLSKAVLLQKFYSFYSICTNAQKLDNLHTLLFSLD